MLFLLFDSSEGLNELHGLCHVISDEQGRPEVENSQSCRCECPALIRLLWASNNSCYITEHRENHNHSMSLTMGRVGALAWPSHKHIDVYTKDLIKQLKGK